MSCPELDSLRQQAAELRKEFLLRRQRARENAGKTGGGALRGHSDYESFLSRKLSRLAEQIDRHAREHGCED